MSEAEVWFAEEWQEPEPLLAPATYDSVMKACAEIFNENDLDFIRDNNLDLHGLVGYLDGLLAFTRQKKAAADYLKEKGIASPIIPSSIFDKITHFIDNNNGKLTLGAIIVANFVFAGTSIKKHYVPWPENTKATLARPARPIARRVAGRLLALRVYHADEVLQRPDPDNPAGVELEINSFVSGQDYYEVTVDMLKDEGGVPDPGTVYDVDVFAGSYVNDGANNYSGQKSLRQEVEIYSLDDVSGAKVWEAEDWQWSPGEPTSYGDDVIHIDSLNLPKYFEPKTVAQDSPTIKEATKENAIWANYLAVETNEALDGDIQKVKDNDQR